MHSRYRTTRTKYPMCIGNKGLSPDCNKTLKMQAKKTLTVADVSLPLSLYTTLSLYLTRRPEGFVSFAVWFAPRGDHVCSPQCSIYGLRFSSRPSTAPEQRAICLPRLNKQEKNSDADWGTCSSFCPANKQKEGSSRGGSLSLLYKRWTALACWVF